MSRLAARRSARSEADLRRGQAREDRWKNERFAVPYRTDRPTVSLGVLWFGAVVLAALTSQWLVGLLAALVAGIAGLQTGHAWAQFGPSDRRVASAMAGVVAVCGIAGTFGLGLGTVIVSVGGVAYCYVGVSHSPLPKTATRSSSPASELCGVLLRSSVPAGLAAGSLVALTGRGSGAAISLLLLVSAYETGDYLVGTGSANAVEGPVAGLAALAVVGAGLVFAQPVPLDTGPKAVTFALLTAACCPLGQLLGSAVLPRGASWAPGLRRLDSLLLAGPLWLLLL